MYEESGERLAGIRERSPPTGGTTCHLTADHATTEVRMDVEFKSFRASLTRRRAPRRPRTRRRCAEGPGPRALPCAAAADRRGGARPCPRRRTGASARSRLPTVAARVAGRADVRAVRLPAVRRSAPRTHCSASAHRARACSRRLAVAIALLSLTSTPLLP